MEVVDEEVDEEVDDECKERIMKIVFCVWPGYGQDVAKVVSH